MAETLALSPADEPNTVSVDVIRSRLEELKALRDSISKPSASEVTTAEDLLLEYKAVAEQVNSWNSSIDGLSDSDLNTYMEWLKKEIEVTEEENMNLSKEISNLVDTVGPDNGLAQIDSAIEELECLLNLKHLENVEKSQVELINGSPMSAQPSGDPRNAYRDINFEIMELESQMKRREAQIGSLEVLSDSLKRVETLAEVESMISEAKVIEFRESYLRVYMKAAILTSDSSVLGHKSDYALESHISDHELLIELDDNGASLKKVEIFPNDVSIDGLVDEMESLRLRDSALSSSLGWFIRQVQYKILLSALGRS